MLVLLWWCVYYASVCRLMLVLVVNLPILVRLMLGSEVFVEERVVQSRNLALSWLPTSLLLLLPNQVEVLHLRVRGRNQ